MKTTIAVLLLAGSSLLSMAQPPVQGPAVDALADPRWQARRQALLELESVAPASSETHQAIVSALGDGDSRVRRTAAQAAGRMGIHSRSGLTGLIGLLQDHDPTVRQAAASALGSVGRSARKAVPDLLEALQDENPQVRRDTLESLGKIGPAKRGEAKLISGHLSDEVPDVRAAAAQALAEFGRSARPALIKALQDDSAEVRHEAARALGEMGESAMPSLIEALYSGNPTVVEAALEAVGTIGPPAARSLRRLLDDDDEPTMARQNAALGLGRVGGADRRNVEALVSALQGPDPGLRLAATRALSQVNPPAPESAPALIQALGDVNEGMLVRKHAAQALGRLGAENADAVAALVTALEDRQPVLHDSALAALAEATAKASPPDESVRRVAALVDELAHPERAVRLSAIKALGQIGPAAGLAVPSLSAMAGSSSMDEALRAAAVTALGLIGPPAQPAVPEMMDAMRGAGPGLRQQILLAVQRIGPPPQETIPRLMHLMEQEDVESRESTALEIRRFAGERLESWRPLLVSAKAPVIRIWAARHPELYGIAKLPDFLRTSDDPDESASLFHVLGGLAAIRETVQLQRLVHAKPAPAERQTIPIDQVAGVEVKSLDFERLLKDTEGEDEELPLSWLVPRDRLMAYFARPGALMKVLDESSGFASRLRSILSRADLDYGLAKRYTAQLGLRDPAVIATLTTADIKNLAVVLPDLYLIDGTDITVIIRCSAPDRAQFLLGKAGVTDLPDKQILQRRTGPHSSAWWAVRDDLILVSTSREELEAVLKLHASNGRNSLGRSDELHYMLKRLPVLASTQAYVYMSDPFLRRLVGPNTKIAHYRRMQVRRDLEVLTSAALLYKLDGHPGSPNCETLQRLGYLPGDIAPEDYSLTPDLVAVSERYGRIAGLHSVSGDTVTLVTRTEADAYRNYVASYSRFWRQFFDPIAVRVDELAPETMDVTTFILPLIESSVYDGVRDFLPRSGPRMPLVTPTLSPPPILTTSVNLSDSMRVDLTRRFAEAFTDYTSVASEVLDSLGPSLHFAIHDSNPIVALGSGDILRASGAGIVGASGELFGLPTLVSLLTQPCQVLVEVQDAAPVVNFLEEASLAKTRKKVPGELYKIKGQEKWIYHVNLDGLVRLSVSVEVRNGYLVIGNLPWSQRVSISQGSPAALNGAQVVLNLEAMQAHLPALHMATMTDYRAMAVEGMGYLYPLLASGHAATVEEAQSRHTDLFGYTPVHPEGGHWIWENGTLHSSLFGTLEHPRQPTYDPNDQSFGLIRELGRVSVNMQMEDQGLRARLRWQSAAP